MPCKCNTARRDPDCTIHHPLSELLVDMAFPGLDRGPEAPEPCEKCKGAGSFWKKEEGGSLSGTRTLCPRCLGTKVQR